MVKRIIKRIAAGLVAALVLLLALSPALVPKAEATIYHPNLNSSESPVVHSIMVPLDKFTNNTLNIGMDNPFYSVCVENGVNMPVRYEPYFDTADGMYYDSVISEWTFGISSISPYGDGSYQCNYFVRMDASLNSVSFSLSNSEPFVTTLGELSYFFERCLYDVMPYYSYTSTFSVNGQYPVLVHEGGWELETFSGYDKYTYYNNTSDPVEIHAFDHFLLAGFPSDLDYDKLIIVDSITLTFNLFITLSDLYVPGTTTGELQSQPAYNQSFSMPVSLNGFGHSFVEFYEEYPGHRVLVSDSPGTSIFDLTEGLKTAVGGFMGTEITPGLSFGGILSAAVGISLVFVLLKFFG